MVSTHRDKARVGTITSRMEHYLEWKDPYPSTLSKDGKEFIFREKVEGLDYPRGALIPPYQREVRYGPTAQEVMLYGLFDRANFLDILQNFTVFETEIGGLVKKIPRYQQFRAVHKIIERLAVEDTPQDKSGVIWHTQGSGKTLTMVFLSIKMRRDPEFKKYKLVFLTDRKNLDQQLKSTFKNTQKQPSTLHHLLKI